MGGLLGGLDNEVRPHMAPEHPVSFSLVVLHNKGGPVGSRRDCTWILGLPGFRVVTIEGTATHESNPVRSGAARCPALSVQWLWPRHGARAICGERTWDDLPWAAHPVTLVYRQRRVDCRRCGIRTERVDFADPKARVTRRLRQQIGVDCQSMPTQSRGGSARRELGQSPPRGEGVPRRMGSHASEAPTAALGLDEIQRGKGQQFWTVLSDWCTAR